MGRGPAIGRTGERRIITSDRLRCTCGLLLFNSKEEAVAVSVPFDVRVNLNTHGRCPDCAAKVSPKPTEVNKVPKTKKEERDERIRNIYHNNYIGLTETADKCGNMLGYVSGVSFSNHCRRLGLRLRTATEAQGSRPMAGQPWVWADEEAAEPSPSTQITLSQNGTVPDLGQGQVAAVDGLTNLVRELLELGGEVHVNLSISIDLSEESAGD